MCPGTSEKFSLKSKNKHLKDRAKTRYVDEASTSTDVSLETDSEQSDSTESSDYNQETNYIKKNTKILLQISFQPKMKNTTSLPEAT